MKALFILKRNESYGFISYTRRSSGLFNSTRFITESLNANGIDSHIVEVQDNNDIDRVITQNKPQIVIIEALWVVPEKFDILKKLHPNVKWFCHMHSGLPFLALEGIAMQWLHEYVKRDIGIIANSPETYETFKAFLPQRSVTYLPNVYLSSPMNAFRSVNRWTDEINIGCFGAIRPMKNHLHQAISAIAFAKKKNLRLNFLINSTRVETNGDPVLKNLIQLFEQTENAHLIFCDWMEPDDFLFLLHDQVDIGMQVSMTETFNVVCADYVTAAVPIVNSRHVPWTSRFSNSKEECVKDTVRMMERAYKNTLLVLWNQFLLIRYSKKSIKAWCNFIRNN